MCNASCAHIMTEALVNRSHSSCVVCMRVGKVTAHLIGCFAPMPPQLGLKSLASLF